VHDVLLRVRYKNMRTSVTNPGSPLIQSVGEIPTDSVVFGRTDSMRLVRERLEKIAGATSLCSSRGRAVREKDIIARLVASLVAMADRSLRQSQLSAIPWDAARKRAVWLRKRRIHRRLRNQAGTGRDGPPGHPVSSTRSPSWILICSLSCCNCCRMDSFVRIGAQEDKKVEVRVVCATNRKLEHEIELGNLPSRICFTASTW